jgi:hypothetical protein
MMMMMMMIVIFCNFDIVTFFSAPKNHALHRIITKKYGRAWGATQNGVFEKRKIYSPPPPWESKLDSTFCFFHLTMLSVAPAYVVSSGGMIGELEVT